VSPPDNIASKRILARGGKTKGKENVEIQPEPGGPLKSKVIVVTGGTVGIGRSVCLALAGEGAKVVVVGRDVERLSETVEELERLSCGADHSGFALDVSIEADMQALAERTLGRYGRIDALIAAAGILRAKGGKLRTVKQMTVDEWDEVIDVNLRGVFLSNRAVLPAMIAQGSGDIINISSTSGRKGLAFDSAYCASKFGVIGMTEALAEETARFGIRIQVLLPGAIDTGMWDQNGPVPRPGDILGSQQVADVILYMLALPRDTMLFSPVIEPLKVNLNPLWMKKTGAPKPEDSNQECMSRAGPKSARQGES
jgi:NAD(P)-dependent dehydrogenase (short-subunit alcohol dehydrogenase family)